MDNPLLDALMGLMKPGQINSPNLSDKDQINQIGPMMNFGGRQPQQPLPSLLPGAVMTPRPQQQGFSDMGPVPGLPADIRGTQEQASYPKAMPAEQGNQRGILDILKGNADILIPLLAGGIGIASGNNNVLAGATGLATGYAKGRENQISAEKEANKDARETADKPVYHKTKSGELKELGRVPYNAIVRNEGDGLFIDGIDDDVADEIAGALTRQTGGAVKQAEAKTKEIQNSKYKIGQIVNVNGKDYKITGFDQDGEALVE